MSPWQHMPGPASVAARLSPIAILPAQIQARALLNPKQAAAYLHVSVDTLMSHAKAGRVKSIIIGTGIKRKRRLFDEADLIEFLETQKVLECPSISPKARRSINTTSRSKVYDFASTGVTSKREAKQIEDGAKEAAKRELVLQAQRENAPMTFTAACARYWIEQGRFAKSSKQIEKHLAYLIKKLGAETPLIDITNNKVADLVAARRGETVDNIMMRKPPKKGTVRAPAKRVSDSTVNRSTLEPLKRVLFRARDLWGEKIAPIDWKRLKLSEPKERIRAASDDEEQRYFDRLPVEYHAITRIAIRIGCRAAECIGMRTLIFRLARQPFMAKATRSIRCHYRWTLSRRYLR